MALALLAAAVLLWTPPSHAQQQQQNPTTSWQLHDPNEYQQEDSHPVRAIASLLSPIGWALEWGVARPWHYVATNTFLAPVLNGGKDDDTWSDYYGTPGPAGEPPIAPTAERGPTASSQPLHEPTASSQPLREQDLSSAPSASSAPAPGRAALGAPPYSAPGNNQSQSVLH